MSTSEDEPRPQPNSMSFAELIQRLRSGGLSSLAGQEDNPHFININSAPDIEAKMFIDPKGNPFYNFGQKFTPEFQGWEPGQRVRSKFFVRIVEGDDEDREDREDRVELLVSESVTGDIRHSDIFILKDLPEADVQELKKLGLAELDATVQVTAPGDYRVSNMFGYPARLDRINAVQETFDGDFSKLKKGAVLVEGELVNYEKNEYGRVGGLQVKLPTGQVIDIELQNGYVSFGGGTLEILDPDYPLPGEKVQVSARYDNPNDYNGAKEEDRLFAYWCRSTFLVEPSKERAETYRVQRQLVAEQLDAIAHAKQPRDIRQAISHIVHTFHAKKDSFSRHTLTKTELRSLRGFVGSRIESEDERPLDLYEKLDVIEDIAKVYGVDITSYSKREFVEFCMRIARAELPPTGKGPSDYPWRLLSQLEPGTSEEILQTAVSSLAQKVIGKKVLYRERQGDEEEAYKPEDIANPNAVTSETKYLFDQSLLYLSDHVSTATAGIYLGLAQAMVDGGKFMKDTYDRREYKEWMIFNAMKLNVINNTKWVWQEKRVEAIKDKSVAKVYISRLPMLRVLSRKMKSEAWTNSGRLDMSGYVDEVILVVEQMDMHFKQQMASLN